MKGSLEKQFRNAAQKGKLGLMYELLAQGVAIDCEDRGGKTALHLAAGEGHSDVVKFLIEHRAHVNARDQYGGHPLDEADYWSITGYDASQRENCNAIITLLEDAGAERCDPFSRTDTRHFLTRRARCVAIARAMGMEVPWERIALSVQLEHRSIAGPSVSSQQSVLPTMAENMLDIIS